jgi:two-component system sensor histidine kinase KdpD
MVEQHQRPNPDELLARIRAEEQQQVRGKLKIFLGYAAGVGKTYAMLEAAHQRKQQGVDVVVAYVQTHGRTETDAMLAELEIVPPKTVEYRGITLREMDVDAVLSRHPQLALVDELAHTNAPGSRHLKRYQDVEELLAHGIDVYATLNIQHIESLNDVVAQITGVTVRETIPDRVIDETTELELIDLPPDELLTRLREGKVYLPDQAAHAIQRFFRAGNLTALRELTMRRAAERVDDQMLAYMQTRAIPGPWPARDHLLVCVSPAPLAERLVRTTRRLADQLNAEWGAIYVETHEHVRLSQADKDRVTRTLHLAEQLGGTSITLPGRSAAEAVLTYARNHNVTKIVVGKPVRTRWYELLRGSVVDQIIRQGAPIDVYVVGGAPEARVPLEVAERLAPHRSWLRYLEGVLLVVAGTLLSALIQPFFSPANLVMIYLLVVVIAALYLGRGPSLLAAGLSVLAFDFFFVPPALTLAVADSEYLLTFAALLIAGLVISTLAVRVREQAETAEDRAAQTAELYALSRDLAVALDLDAIMRAIVAHVSQTFGPGVAVLLPESPHEAIKPRALSPGFELNENEFAVAAWAFEHGRPAGWGTDTLRAACARYLPLRTARGVVGVLGVKPSDPKTRLTTDQSRLLDAFASQAALAIERTQLADRARQAEVAQATEELQAALLHSISHDLRTPLVSITGALSTLQEDDVELNQAARRSLVENAREEAERLNQLVGNLLDMTRIEAGALRVAREPCDVQDVIGAALEPLDDRLSGRPLTVDVPPDMPLVPMDFVLMVQVLVNLLDNALKYSSSGTPIEVKAQVEGSEARIQVADRGMGIPADDLGRVFDKFYRVQRPGQMGGTGLGLSICRGFVEAQGGRIWAENREGGGTVITISLPLHAPGEATP